MVVVDAVGALGRAGEAQHLGGGAQAAEERLPLERRRVVRLVDDHHVERLRVEVVIPEGVDRCEHVAPNGRLVPLKEQLSKVGRLQRRPVNEAGLLEDLPAVGDEEKRVDPPSLAQPGVVEGRHHRLARSGRSHEQVAMPAQGARRSEFLEDGLLERLWLELEEGLQPGIAIGLRERAGESLPVRLQAAIERLEEREVRPVLAEGLAHLGEQGRLVALRDAHVPLEPVGLGSVREIGAADVGRRDAAVAVEIQALA